VIEQTATTKAQFRQTKETHQSSPTQMQAPPEHVDANFQILDAAF
jgi:hypothetical protein